jgi:cysteine desulfurase
LKGVVEVAREQVAELIGAQASEVIFTSCGTESNNAAIHAALTATGKRHIVTSAVEHSSVLDLCKALESNRGLHGSRGLAEGGQPSRLPPKVGRPSRLSPSLEQRQAGSSPYNTEYHVTCLPVDRDGLLKLADLEDAITDETAVVSLMWANNETGVLFPVKEIAEVCRARGVLFHCDAVQAA